MAKKRKPKREEEAVGEALPASSLKQEGDIMYSIEFFRKQGKRGGRLGGVAGGKASAAALTPEERSEKARKAVQVRWAKYRKEKKKNEQRN